MKICSKCKIEKDLSEFSKDKKEKDSLYYICKQCAKKNDEKRYKNNKNKINEKHQKYNNSKANYNTYAQQIFWAKDPVKNVDGFLQTKCTYCGRWYFPSILSIRNRIQALNRQVGNGGVENRLYCSDKCKNECPIYGQVKYPKGFKNYSRAREVQPELRQMVFERDEYICIKCGKHQDELLNVPLHCHHIEGIVQNPIESADIDICVTVCKNCHSEIHQENGCGYNDMKCKTKEKK